MVRVVDKSERQARAEIEVTPELADAAILALSEAEVLEFDDWGKVVAVARALGLELRQCARETH